MPPVGFKPTISADERPQTYALDRAVTGNGNICVYFSKIKNQIQLNTSDVYCIHCSIKHYYKSYFETEPSTVYSEDYPHLR